VKNTYKAIYWIVFSLMLVYLSFSVFSCTAAPTTPPGTTPAATKLTTPVVSESGVTVHINQSKSNVSPGDTVAVKVIIDSDIEVRGAQCALSFNPTIVACDRVEEGGFLGDWAKANACTTIMVPQPNIDNNTGHVSDMGIAIMGTAKGGAKGNGTLCTYYFTAKSSGAIIVTLSNVHVADLNGTALTPDVTNSTSPSGY
jgi:hypothetical protein